jgi:hypothetical protein
MWCKTKNLGGAKCKRHRSIGENCKIPGGAPAPPHIHTAPPMIPIATEYWEVTFSYVMRFQKL